MSSCLAAIHCSLWPLHCSGSRRRRLAGRGEGSWLKRVGWARGGRRHDDLKRTGVFGGGGDSECHCSVNLLVHVPVLFLSLML